MPLYEFKCAECGKVDERYLPMQHRTPEHCGEPMKQLFSVPAPPVMVSSAQDWALDSLNGDGHKNGLSPREKGKGLEKDIMKGLERNRPMVYSGFG